MRHRARRRGIDVREGVAEDRPYDVNRFDVVLLVTTICFVDDVEQSLAEAYRVLAPGGRRSSSESCRLRPK
ncbi:MAG: class I SAM-dependent methyltransferase [Salinibacter sp.]